MSAARNISYATFNPQRSFAAASNRRAKRNSGMYSLFWLKLVVRPDQTTAPQEQLGMFSSLDCRTLLSWDLNMSISRLPSSLFSSLIHFTSTLCTAYTCGCLRCLPSFYLFTTWPNPSSSGYTISKPSFDVGGVMRLRKNTEALHRARILSTAVLYSTVHRAIRHHLMWRIVLI